MSRVRSKSQPRPANRLLHATVFLSAMLSISLQDNIARAADLWPDSFRVGKSIQKFEETWQYAVAWQLRAPRRIRAQYLDLAVGVIKSPGDSRTFISLGPVWRLPIVADRFSVGNEAKSG